MKDQILRVLFGTFFLALAIWGTLENGMSPGSFLVAYLFGVLLLVRALPLAVWKRWQYELHPP